MLKTKEVIESWLNNLGITQYVINHNLTVDVNTNVDISNKKLISLPIQFGIIQGDFNCSYNQLANLRGCPTSVHKNFDCSNNHLTDLNYCPSLIGGDFDCSENTLISLKGCCIEVGGNFMCGNNQLKTLQYGPKEVNNHYDCGFNEIANLNHFKCDIGKYFSHSKLDGKPIKELKRFYDSDKECQNISILGKDLNALLQYNKLSKTIPKDNLIIHKKIKI